MRYFKDTVGSGEIGRILALFLLFAPLAAPAAVYQWRDADGTVVYSQTPPPDGSARKVPPPPPPPRPEQARKSLEKLRQQLEDRREDRRLSSEKAAQQKKKAQIRRQNCERARNNLQRVEQRPHALVSDGKGGMHRMTAEEWQQRLEQYRKDVEKFCR